MFNLQVEGQRAAQAQAQQENAVLSKVEKIRIDQSRRADALEAEAKIEENKVSLIYNKKSILREDYANRNDFLRSLTEAVNVLSCLF